MNEYRNLRHFAAPKYKSKHFQQIRGATVRSFADVEHEVKMLREKWKLGLGPIPSLTGLLEEQTPRCDTGCESNTEWRMNGGTQ